MIMSLALIPIILIVGFMIDFRRGVSLKQQLQAHLDMVMLTAAHADESEVKARAEAFFAASMGKLSRHGPELEVEILTTEEGLKYRGVLRADLPLTLSAISGRDSWSLEAVSVVPRNFSTSSDGCIYVLDETDYQAFLVNSGADVVAPNCDVHIHSTRDDAAVFNAGIDLDFHEICFAGQRALNNGGELGNLRLGCSPKDDPYQNKIPTPTSLTCEASLQNLNFNGGDVVLDPGVYCGWTNFNSAPNVTFNPGVYVIRDGGWNVNGGTWAGDGVTFYFHDQSKIQFNSGVAADLKPPASGDYANVIMFENEALEESHFVLDDSNGFNISGIVHLPSRNAIYNSGSNIEARKLTLVFNTLILDETKWTLESGAAAGQVEGLRARIRLIE